MMQASSSFTAFPASTASKTDRRDRWSLRRRLVLSMLGAGSAWIVLIAAVLEVSRLIAHTSL